MADVCHDFLFMIDHSPYLSNPISFWSARDSTLMDLATLFKEVEPISLQFPDGALYRPGPYVIESVSSEDLEPILPLDTENLPRYLHGFKLFVIMLALLLSMFLVRLILNPTPILSWHTELIVSSRSHWIWYVVSATALR